MPVILRTGRVARTGMLNSRASHELIAIPLHSDFKEQAWVIG